MGELSINDNGLVGVSYFTDHGKYSVRMFSNVRHDDFMVYYMISLNQFRTYRSIDCKSCNKEDMHAVQFFRPQPILQLSILFP